MQAAAPGERSYSEKQVAEILKRAALLEQGRAPQTSSLSLAEVEAIARESGLDPALVRAAARSLDATEQEKSTTARLFGAPTHRTIERVVDGELTMLHHERLVGDLRALVPGSPFRPAQIASIGRTLTVSAESSGAMVEISLTPRDGRTFVRIEVSNRALAGGLLGGLGGGLGGGLMPVVIAAAVTNHLGPAGVVASGAALLVGAFTLARGLYSRLANRSYRNFERVADSLVERLREELRQ